MESEGTWSLGEHCHCDGQPGCGPLHSGETYSAVQTVAHIFRRTYRSSGDLRPTNDPFLKAVLLKCTKRRECRYRGIQTFIELIASDASAIFGPPLHVFAHSKILDPSLFLPPDSPDSLPVAVHLLNLDRDDSQMVDYQLCLMCLMGSLRKTKTCR